MNEGGRSEQTPRSHEHATGVVVPFPRGSLGERLDLGRALPTTRSLALAFGILAAGILLWVLARETTMFAVRAVEIDGAPPGVAVQVRRVLAAEVGRSLVSVDPAHVRSSIEALPTVASASVDRAFPHMLRITVVPERAVGVLRQGAISWLVSRRGLVMAKVDRRARPRLPRVLVSREVNLEPGRSVVKELRPALDALEPLAATRFRARVASVDATGNELELRLRSGLRLALGSHADTDLKLAVAARILPLLADDVVYLDVSVPERPVAGTTPEPAAAQLPAEGEATPDAAAVMPAQTSAVPDASGAPVPSVETKPQVKPETLPSTAP